MESESIKIPERISKEVITHLVANLIAEKQESFSSRKIHIPLLLGIHGKSGQGKSFQIEQILKVLNYKIYHISGSQLESENAGEPAKLIKQTYMEAGSFFAKTKDKGVAIVIDDIDAGLGHWGDNHQYTVNTQIVNATLMHLADNPKSVDNTDVSRIPILLTGNDFTKVYEPITRPGRMRAFLWEPTTEEKIDILSPIYPHLSNIEINQLVNTFPNEPLAFFINLNSYIFQEKVWNLFCQERHLLEKILGGNKTNFNINCLLYDLIEVGQQITMHSNFNNHLKK